MKEGMQKKFKLLLCRPPGAEAECLALGLRLVWAIQSQFKGWSMSLSLSLWGMLGGLLLTGCQAPEAEAPVLELEPSVSGQLRSPGPPSGSDPSLRSTAGSTPRSLPGATPSLPAAGLSPPLVQGDRLWGHLTALVGQRHSQAERAATRRYVTEQLTRLGWQVEAQPFGTGVNLVATYPMPTLGSGEVAGDDPGAGQGQEILLAAHYDTVLGSPGANDNGTGVALLLEVAQLYGEQQAIAVGEPRAAESTVGRSLRLVFFDQEERGLLGSLAYASQPENLLPIRSAVVLDMLGYRCDQPGCQTYPEFLRDQAPSDIGDFIAVVGEMERPGLLAAFSLGADAQLPRVFAVPVPLKGVLTPDVLRSDHAPFWLNGVGAVLITDTANLRNPHYHQPTDDLDQVDRAFFVGVSQRVVNGLWRLLSQP